MKTKNILINNEKDNRVWEISEVIYEGDTKKRGDLIGHIKESISGYIWIHSAMCRKSASYHPTKTQALRGLQTVHEKHKNGVPGYL